MNVCVFTVCVLQYAGYSVLAVLNAGDWRWHIWDFVAVYLVEDAEGQATEEKVTVLS